jgi:hypothetical protein
MTIKLNGRVEPYYERSAEDEGEQESAHPE